MYTIRGCPQGSVMGPLIFSIYINDLPLVIKHCLSIIFADDTQLCIAGSPNKLHELKQKLTTDLKNIIDWMDRNGMKLNLEKTQLIVLGNAQNLTKIGEVTLEIHDIRIKSTETLKSLGLTIDSKLTWYDHINKVSRSYHLMARSLYPLRHLMYPETFLKIINACLLPKLRYMACVWGTASKKILKILENKLRSTARIVLNIGKYEKIKFEIYDKLKWFFPCEQYLYQCLCLVFQILKGISADYFIGLLNYTRDIHMHGTRVNDKNILYVPNVHRNNFGKRSLIYKACLEYNKLPTKLTESQSLQCFKDALSAHIIEQGKINCKKA